MFCSQFGADVAVPVAVVAVVAVDTHVVDTHVVAAFAVPVVVVAGPWATEEPLMFVFWLSESSLRSNCE